MLKRDSAEEICALALIIIFAVISTITLDYNQTFIKRIATFNVCINGVLFRAET